MPTDDGPRWVNELSKTKVDRHHQHLPPVPCWYDAGVRIRAKATPVCEWSAKAERTREGMNISPLSLASLPVRKRGKREETWVPSPENAVPRMPWLVGNRVTCHRSRRINKLARSDEFGSILEPSVSRKKWFVRITRVPISLEKASIEKFPASHSDVSGSKM